MKPPWLENAIGRWVHEDEDSDAEFVITGREGEPQVVARCLSDDEQMDVQNLSWNEDGLTFETIVPSSGYHTVHRMRFPDFDRCEHELTLRETWKRVTSPSREQ
jgi:hypothetical protein